MCDKFWHSKKDLDDGRTIYVIERTFNTIITIGTGHYTHDNQW